jgi:hypothetical protein
MGGRELEPQVAGRSSLQMLDSFGESCAGPPVNLTLRMHTHAYTFVHPA